MVGKRNTRYAQLRVAITKLEMEEFVLDMEQRSINVRLKGVQMMPRVMDESVEGMGLRKSTGSHALRRDAIVMHKREDYVINTEQDILILVLVRCVLMKDVEILHSREEFAGDTELYGNDVYTMVVMLRQDPREFVLNTERK